MTDSEKTQLLEQYSRAEDFRAGFAACAAVWLALGVAGAQAQAAAAPHCRDDMVSDTNGVLISLGSGLAYEAYPGSQSILSTWMPLDKVTVCRIGGNAVHITNKSKRNQSVNALRIFPQNAGQI
jgi:hypothetical protein